MSDPAASGEEAVAALRHDLRTPLNQIIGYSELVAEDLEGEENARTREDLEKIGRAARGLADLITREIQPGRIVLLEEGRDARPRASGTEEEGGRAGRSSLPQEEVIAPAAITAKILIVDDQEENCVVLQRRLEKEGHTCAAVYDGATAL